MSGCRISYMVAGIIVSVLPLSLSAQARTDGIRPQANLILLSEEEARVERSTMLLDLVRKRFPIVVQQGRFLTDDGPANSCVYARRSSARSALPVQPGALPTCAMIAAFVDGVRISNAADYLATTPAHSLESIELLRAGEANFRYGGGADGGEVLVMWTRGRGPYAPVGI